MEQNFLRYLKLVLAIAFFVTAGILILGWLGNYFVAEITQEVFLPEQQLAELKEVVLGKPAPYFDLKNLSGERFNLSEFKNKNLILTFWTTWNQLAADQIRIWDEYLRVNKSDFEVRLINSQEDKVLVESFLKRGGYEVPVLVDERGAVTDSYGARVLPVSYFINKNGTVELIHVGVLDSKALIELSLKTFQ